MRQQVWICERKGYERNVGEERQRDIVCGKSVDGKCAKICEGKGRE